MRKISSFAPNRATLTHLLVDAYSAVQSEMNGNLMIFGSVVSVRSALEILNSVVNASYKAFKKKCRCFLVGSIQEKLCIYI